MKQALSLSGKDFRANRAVWIIVLVVVLALIPIVWLAFLDIRTNDQLIDTMDHGLRANAQLHAERMQNHLERRLVEENLLLAIRTLAYAPTPNHPVSPVASGSDLTAPNLVDGLFEYAFIIDSRTHQVQYDRSVTNPDEVERVFGLDSLFLRSNRNLGRLFRGHIEGPYGDFHYVYKHDIIPGEGHPAVRGVKVNPDVVREVLIPEAYLALRQQVESAEGVFPDDMFGIEVAYPGGMIVLSALSLNSVQRRTESRGVYESSLAAGGLFPDWTIRVIYFNHLRGHRYWRYIAILIPLMVVGIGVAVAVRASSRVLELNRSKTAFVSNVSHELKTPLSKIRFFNDILRSGRVQSEEKQQRYFEVIEQECERLALMVDNVLDFSRIERGQMTYSFEEVRPQDIIEDVTETFSLLYNQRGYGIETHIEDSLPVMMLDAGAIRQTLINLLDNAVKYSEPHTIHVRVFLEADDRSPAACIAVEDQGIGIPRNMLGEVFNEFYRVDTRLSQRVSGSGLGLAIVRHAVEAHGGDIHVESTLGEGSTFTIRLPLESLRRTTTDNGVAEASVV